MLIISTDVYDCGLLMTETLYYESLQTHLSAEVVENSGNKLAEQKQKNGSISTLKDNLGELYRKPKFYYVSEDSLPKCLYPTKKFTFRSAGVMLCTPVSV